MIYKDISVSTESFRIETSANVDCGFLLTTTSYDGDSNSVVSEIFIGIDEAEQVVKMLQESIDFSKKLEELEKKQ